ncbi:MAG TPA: peptidoglycan binding domain-containing protein, partial [Magnetospirillaceae bacterium]|nr:peptidoglycan binding domain-containing protein [Magnetospirillaceae bacterium]
MKANKTSESTQKPARPHWHPPRGYFVVWAVVVLASAFVGYLNLHFDNRVLPNVFVGTTQVGGLKKDEVRNEVIQQIDQVQVTFQDGDQKVTVPASELGVEFNIDATVQQVMLSRRSQNITSNLSPSAHSVPLVYSNDAGQLKAYIAAHFPNIYVDPQDAQVVFNPASRQFDVKPSVPGRGFDIKFFESSLPDIAKSPRAVVLPVTTVAVEPLINDLAGVKAQQAANELLTVPLSFMRDGRTAYTASPADIANWLHFIPDTTVGTLTVEIDQAKARQFLTDVVASKITTLPVDRKVVVDKETGDERVIQAGRKGYQIKDVDKLTQDVLAAVANKQGLSRELDVTEAPFKTVTMTGYGKWIEVDLSRQTTTLYIGNEVVGSFLVSTGKAATPTAIAEGRVYAKYPMQTMTGT